MSIFGDIFGDSGLGGFFDSIPDWLKNPDIISAGLTTAGSLAAGLLGQSAKDDLSQQTLDEQRRQFDVSLAEAEKERALRLQLAQIAAGAAGGGGGPSAAERAAALKVEALTRGAATEQQAMQNAIQGVVAALKG